MTKATQTDVIIIGAGTAGLAALKQVQKETDDFLLINEGEYGTTCARVGCMPSKLLIEAANAYHHRHTFSEFGIQNADQLTVDIPAVFERVRHLRDYFVSSTLSSIRDIEDKVITGRACLTGPNTISVNDQLISAKKIIIATGSRPIVPADWEQMGAEKILTTNTLFEQKNLKARIAVIGLGAIGIEMAQALSRLGIKVTAFGAESLLAGLTDKKVSDALKQALTEEFDVYTDAKAELVETESGVKVVSEHIEVEVDQVLVAVGRRPNLDGMGLNRLDVALDDKGMPEINPNTTQVEGTAVFIAGDASADKMLLHEVADEGRIAGHNVLSDGVNAYCRRTPLSMVFSEPGSAMVGLSYAELDEQDIVIGEVDYADQGRARAAQRNKGLMRIYLNKQSGKILGAEMTCPAAEHMVHTLALAISQELTATQVLAMPIYHPVLEEGMRTALRQANKQLQTSQGFDLSRCDEFKAEALD